MKKATTAILAAALCALLVLQALGAGGTADDPVVSYSYLNGTMKASLLDDAQELVDRNERARQADALKALAEAAARQNQQRKAADNGSYYLQGRLLLKSGDVLTLAPGAQVTVLYGAARSDSPNLVNITNGNKLTSGYTLRNNSCYMKNASAEGGITVTSETCELYLDGVYTLSYSDATDYASLADALYEMGLFAGSAGAVTGYALEQSCTRIEGLVMFLRLIGAADEAAAYSGTHPFVDVPQGHWAYSYLAYAYARGLAYGTSASRKTFSPDEKISAQDYLTFLLRALHYDEGTDFAYTSVLSDAVTLGLFSSRELGALNRTPFLRAQMVYLSFYTLFGIEQTQGRALLLQLIAQGDVDADAAVAGLCLAAGERIS